MNWFRRALIALLLIVGIASAARRAQDVEGVTQDEGSGTTHTLVCTTCD